MAGVEVREVTTSFGETAPAGSSTRDERSWQLGAEVDGVWVPFATVNQGQYDHYKQRHEAQQAKEPQPQQESTPQPASKAGRQ